MSLTPFLMFEGRAREAIDLYTSVIPRSSVDSVVHFPAEAQPEGDPATPLIMMAVVSLDGQSVKINDTPIKHGFTFTPSTSLYFQTDDAAEYEAVLSGLGEDGSFLMPDSDVRVRGAIRLAERPARGELADRPRAVGVRRPDRMPDGT